MGVGNVIGGFELLLFTAVPIRWFAWAGAILFLGLGGLLLMTGPTVPGVAAGSQLPAPVERVRFSGFDLGGEPVKVLDQIRRVRGG